MIKLFIGGEFKTEQNVPKFERKSILYCNHDSVVYV